MLDFKKERTCVGRTAEYVRKYVESGEIGEDFGAYLMNLSRAAAVNMKLRLQGADYDDALMCGAEAAMKYGLKNIAKVKPEKAYYYLLMACRSGICRFLEKHNRYRKRYVLTDFAEQEAADGEA